MPRYIWKRAGAVETQDYNTLMNALMLLGVYALRLLSKGHIG